MGEDSVNCTRNRQHTRTVRKNTLSETETKLIKTRSTQPLNDFVELHTFQTLWRLSAVPSLQLRQQIAFVHVFIQFLYTYI